MKTPIIKISKGLKYFFGIIVLYFIILFLNKWLTTEDVLYNTYKSAEFVEKILEQQRKFGWLSYIILPIYHSIKFLLICVVLNIGLILLEFKIDFGALWRTVLKAELVPIVFTFLIFILMAFNNFQTLDQMDAYHPFSLISYVKTDNIPKFLYYPISVVSLSEITYWIILSILVKKLINKNFLQSLGFVAKTYGLGLLIWISLIIFLSINVAS